MTALNRRLLAEFLGTAVLVATVVGSGIMGTRLSSDLAVVLLVNAVATVLVLGLMIWALGPISGAHFNPAVTAVVAWSRQLPWREAGSYMAVQAMGALSGAALANLMFEFPAVHAASHERTGAAVWLGEVVATAGLLFVISVLTRTGQSALAALAVPAWIGAAYFFTSSTSFANPAVTIGRSISDTFAGIAPASVAGFIAAQCAGAALGSLLASALVPQHHHTHASNAASI